MSYQIALRRARASVLALAALVSALALSPAALAQEEGALTVLDEPIVQVNNDVIMLSTLKRENREFRDVLIKQRGMAEQQADEEIAKKQPEIIFSLINEALLMQKGRDTPGLMERVEADVNREILRVAASQGFKTIDELDTAMRGEGLSLSDVRDALRKQYTRQAVFQNEVDAKIYFGLNTDEVKRYYETNRAKFQGVTLSEIFLSLAGRPEAEVKAKAAQLAAQARGAGADFGALAATNSERERGGERVAVKTKGAIVDEDGKAKWFLVSELLPSVAPAVKDLKAGGVTDPIRVDDGYLILRVNEREDTFRENQVRGMITQERGDKEREQYLRGLRNEAYIKPATDYKAVVEPLLSNDKPAATTTPQKAPDSKNDKDKKSVSKK